jgi:hypothetical protein
LWRSWSEWQIAVFSLEREFSSRRLGRSALISVLLVIFFCFEFFMASFIMPGLPADVFLTTPTLDLISTPTGTLSAEMMTQFANLPSQYPAAVQYWLYSGADCFTFPEPGDEVKGIDRTDWHREYS